MSKLKIAFYLNWLLIVVICFFSIRQCRINKKDAESKGSIIASKERLFLNDSLRHASEVDVWSIKYKELKIAHETGQALGIKNLSEMQQFLAKAYDVIELYKRKNKDLISYYSALLQARDTIYQPMPADCELKPIKTKYIDIDFIYQDSIVGISYNYHTGISTLVTMYPKLKTNGKKHFPNWGFIWGWDKKSIMTIEDKNAILTNQIAIEFEK